MAINVTYAMYTPVFQIFLGLIPTVIVWLMMFIGSSMASFVISSLWRIQNIRIWWCWISCTGRSIFKILRHANPSQQERTVQVNSQVKTKRQHSADCSYRRDMNYDTWRKRITYLNESLQSIRTFSSNTFLDCSYLLAILFWIYTATLYAGAFCYFLFRIFTYRLGYLRMDTKSRKQSRQRIPPQFRSYTTPTRRRRFYKKSRWKRVNKSHTKMKRNLLPDILEEVEAPVAFTTVLNIDDRVNNLERDLSTWDTDSSSMVCDNSANVHICNKRSMFVGDLTPVINHKVATIGGKGHQPSGIGTVRWTWRDVKGKMHQYNIEDVLYFPESPINILSVTAFAKQLNDTEGTGIDTKQLHSNFYWSSNQFSLRIQHPPSNLPEVSINEGFSLATVYRAMVSKLVNSSNHDQYSCCFTKIDDESDAAELTDGTDSSCPHAHATTFEETPDTVLELFEIGETLYYTNTGWSGLVKVKSFELDDKGVLRFVVTSLASEEDIKTTSTYLRSPSNPDIGWIPTSIPEYNSTSRTLSEEEIEKITSPTHLSPLQQEFLSVHYKLNHLPFAIMLRLSKFGFLPQRFLKLRNAMPPCVSCMFGKAHRRPWRGKRSAIGNNDNITGGRRGKRQLVNHGGVLRGPTLSQPGEEVGTDQIVSAQPGLVPQEKGKLTRARIWGATVFIDYFSSKVKVHLMQDASGESTNAAKNAFERDSMSHDVQIKHYHADNGRFADTSFKDDCDNKLQQLTFCGVGAHHQNGIAERSIKELTLTSRTMLLHAQRHWPEYITTMLWPFALLAAADQMNNLRIDEHGNTPQMRFSKVSGHKTRLSNFHTFGCPVYILDSRLQSAGGAGPPKWDPRCRLGIYVGQSPSHASNVALVLNPKSGLVSPQFHVVFDDNFSTVPNLRVGTVPENWKQLVDNSREKSLDGFYDLTKTWFEGEADPTAVTPLPSMMNSSNENVMTLAEEFTAESLVEDNATPLLASDQAVAAVNPEDETAQASRFENIADTAPAFPSESHFETIINMDSDMPPIVDLATAGLRRSPRLAAQNADSSYSSWFTCNTIMKCVCVFGVVLASAWSPSPSKLHSNAQNLVFATVNSFHSANMNFDNTMNALHPMAFLAEADSNESYTFRQMLKQSDASDFIQAMIKEANDHETREHWEVIPRWQKPPDEKTILAIWSFKRKRFPDGRINKHKARLCAHGGMQTYGVNYWETYAPTVNWISVRFLLVVAQVLDLNTQAIDFVLAFPQADLDVPVYMELPAGMELAGHGNRSNTYVLRLKKNLYGLKNASLNWHQKLKTALEGRDFVESLSDPCVFISKKVIILVYVDDVIIISKDSGSIDEFIKSLEDGSENFDFTREGTFESYLGVKITQLPENKGFQLSQPFLIERIIHALGFDLTTTKGSRDNIPAGYPLLNKDEEGSAPKSDWKYRGLIGMLGYLQGTTRPDIAMATHQCARFSNCVKLSHERAVKRIGRYLLDTRDKGIIYKPDISRGLECFVDADFAGGWKDGNHDEPASVLSRTGYVIMYAGCPITWGSKMQTEIALSTTESEYIALSTAMREVIPFMNLMKEIADTFGLLTRKPVFRCTVWEDNESCITVAKSPKFTPRTKHIAIKYHHFRKFVADETLIIKSIDTAEQIADIFTKPLPEKAFCYLRQKLMGW